MNDDEARKIILARRARFIAAAVAGLGVACGKEGAPQACLQVPAMVDDQAAPPPPPNPHEGTATDASSTDAGSTDAGSTDAGSTDAGPPRPGPQPCLRVAPPKPCLTVPAPRPQPCLNMAKKR